MMLVAYSLNEFCCIERSDHIMLGENTMRFDSIVNSIIDLSAKQLDCCENERVYEKYKYLLNKVSCVGQNRNGGF
jgi:hypothetical protein